MHRLIAALLLTLAACSGDGGDGDTGASVVDTALVYSCTCLGYDEADECDGGWAINCHAGNDVQCLDACRDDGGPCCPE